METIGKYKIHEMASRLPMMTDDQYASLKESLRTQGLMHPIITLDKEPVVIDGRNRLKACLELGIEPQFIKLSDFLSSSMDRRADTMRTGELTGLMAAEQTGELEKIIQQVVIMENVLRRHLPDFAKYEQLKAIEEPLKQEGKKQQGKRTDLLSQVTESKKPHNTRQELVTKSGLSSGQIAKAKVIDRNADEATKDKLRKGKTTIGKVYNQLAAEKSGWDNIQTLNAAIDSLKRWESKFCTEPVMQDLTYFTTHLDTLMQEKRSSIGRNPETGENYEGPEIEAIKAEASKLEYMIIKYKQIPALKEFTPFLTDLLDLMQNKLTVYRSGIKNLYPGVKKQSLKKDSTTVVAFEDIPPQ